MRRPLPAALFALGTLLLTQPADAQARGADRTRPARIAVFDSRVVFDSLPERVALESEFALEQAKARTMLGQATDSLRAAVEEFSRQESRLSPRQREAVTMNLRARELLVEEMVANLDQIILRKQSELQAPLRERLRQAVRSVRVREGYDLVIDLANDGSIVDADPRIDLTASILRELRNTRREPDASAGGKVRQ
jgi:outer membrane protein